MITKERLEELIKEGTTVYSLDNNNVCLTYLNKDYNNINKVYWGNTPYFEYWLYYQNNIYKPLNKLYETEKQAKWALNHHASRTEELDLPTWEEFKDYHESISVSFVGDDWEIYELSHGKNRIYLCENDDVWLEWDFNEENYKKACDLCLKLFKGEEDGNC